MLKCIRIKSLLLLAAVAQSIGFDVSISQGSDTLHLKPFPVPVTDFRGYDRYSFLVNDSKVMVICPKKVASGRPWIWRGAFWGDKVYPFTEQTVVADLQLLDKGFYLVVAGPSIPLGHPEANKGLDEVYREMTTTYGLAKKPALVGMSREGLWIYGWASENPEKVSCIYLDNGVCDFKSWPGGKGGGKGDTKQWEYLLKVYKFISEEEALAYKRNPIDLLAPLAQSNVPLLHVCGASDDTVPYEENTGLVKSRYEALGGNIQVILKPGAGHHPHGLEDPTPIVEFISKNGLSPAETGVSTK